MHPMTSLASSSKTAVIDSRSQESWKIELLYDGQCPLCLREVRFLEAQDRGRGLIRFVDVMDPSYAPTDHGGVTFEAAMGRIHAVKCDGTVLQGVEVFRQVYAVLGIGWIYAATRWPGIRPLVDTLYDRWADWRLALTGRPPLAKISRQREALGCCTENDRTENSNTARCRMPAN